MSVALPTQIVDAVTSATTTGMELAGSVLHSVANAAEAASDATSHRAARMIRISRRNLPHRSSPVRGRVLTLAGVAAAMLVVLAVRRALTSRRSTGVSVAPDVEHR